MRVLLVHNFYHHAGGEDVVFATERDLLKEHGVEVHEYTRHNDEIGQASPTRVAGGTVWARGSYRDLEALLRQHRPDLAHFHNTFPLVSPSGYYACRAAGVPVVQTLHNYRLLCPSATLFREGRPCEACVGRAVPWPGVVHACYRGNRAATAVVAGMLSAHRAMGTWSRLVHVYVALSEFARRKFIEGGLPPDRIAVKPNVLRHPPAPGPHQGGYGLFVGRLSPEKGLRTLLEAWRLAAPEASLRIVGSGPLEGLTASAPEGVEWLGAQPRDAVFSQMREATFLALPSEWYEGGFPLVALEAYACGLPVIASRLGCMEEVVRDGVTGLLFPPGDPVALAEKIRWALGHPESMREMGDRARRLVEAEYSADQNYHALMNLYDRARSCARAAG